MSIKKKKLTPIYIREKNLVSRQFRCTYNNKSVLIKHGENDTHIEVNFNGNSKNEFCSCFSLYKIKLTFWYCDFLDRWEKLLWRMKTVGFPESWYVNSYPVVTSHTVSFEKSKMKLYCWFIVFSFAILNHFIVIITVNVISQDPKV